MHPSCMLRVPPHACCWHTVLLIACCLSLCLLSAARSASCCRMYTVRHRNACSTLHACHAAISAYCRLLVRLVASRIAFRLARRAAACLLFVGALLAVCTVSAYRQPERAACDACLNVQALSTTLEADSKHARRSSLCRANSGHRERYVGY